MTMAPFLIQPSAGQAVTPMLAPATLSLIKTKASSASDHLGSAGRAGTVFTPGSPACPGDRVGRDHNRLVGRQVAPNSVKFKRSSAP